MRYGLSNNQQQKIGEMYDNQVQVISPRQEYMTVDPGARTDVDPTVHAAPPPADPSVLQQRVDVTSADLAQTGQHVQISMGDSLFGAVTGAVEDVSKTLQNNQPEELAMKPAFIPAPAPRAPFGL